MNAREQVRKSHNLPVQHFERPAVSRRRRRKAPWATFGSQGLSTLASMQCCLRRRPSYKGTPLRGCEFNSVPHWCSTMAPALRFYRILNAMQALQGFMLLHILAALTAAQLQMQPELAFRAMEIDDNEQERRSRSYRAKLRTVAVIAYILSQSNAFLDVGVGRGNGHRHRTSSEIDLAVCRHNQCARPCDSVRAYAMVMEIFCVLQCGLFQGIWIDSMISCNCTHCVSQISPHSEDQQ